MNPERYWLGPNSLMLLLLTCYDVVVAAQVEREEEMGMAPDTYSEVFGLAQRGTLAFRDRRFDEVIAEFSLLSRLFFVCAIVHAVELLVSRCIRTESLHIPHERLLV
jgi:hypothetical protein